MINRQVPDEWKTVSIGEILTLGSGQDYKHLEKGDIPVYGTGGYMTSVNEYLYDGESVGIGRKGTIDKPVLLKGKFWTVDTLFYTHSFKNVIPFYVFLLFQSINWRRFSEATGVPSLSKNIIEPIKILLPPLPEQQKIAEILSTVDAKIEIIDQQITETQELKKGLMQQLLTGKLSVIENRLLSEAEMKDSSLGKIPKSWEVVKLSNVTSKIGDGIHSTPKYVKDSDYHFVNGNNLINGQLTIFQKTKCVSKSEYERLKIDLKENSVLMSINGTIGNLAFYKNEKVVFGKSAAFITSDDSKLNYKFLYFYLQTSFLIKYYSNELTGTTIKNLSLKSIRNTPIFIPSLQEQNKISTILSTMDEKLEVLIEKKTNYQDLKQGLMQQLLTGKIRIQPALEA